MLIRERFSCKKVKRVPISNGNGMILHIQEESGDRKSHTFLEFFGSGGC